ncbi:MAG: hypothetical protein KDK39_01375 [Leptospiraceae bacterium]|nr:hypothetical protein [Leptospiraceae bacterium]
MQVADTVDEYMRHLDAELKTRQMCGDLLTEDSTSSAVTIAFLYMYLEMQGLRDEYEHWSRAFASRHHDLLNDAVMLKVIECMD